MSFFNTTPTTATKTLRVLAHLLSYPDAELRAHVELARMRILQRGNRLSVTPVDPSEWTFVLTLAGRKH